MPLLLVLAVVAVAVIVLLSRRDGGAASAAWRAEARPLLSPRELEFMGRLMNALDDLPVHVCPQASIDEFVRFTGSDAFAQRGRYRARRSDFVLIDERARVVLAIEIDDASHDRKRDQDAARDAVLASAGIPTLRLPKGQLPSTAALRVKLRATQPSLRAS